MQINYDEVLDEIWSPFLGKIFEGNPTRAALPKKCNVSERAESANRLSIVPGRNTCQTGGPDQQEMTPKQPIDC